jgi:hypothetical protein
MRLVGGRTLADAVRDYHRERRAGEAGPLGLRELLTAVVGACNAVAYARSRSVPHRTLNPQNVALGEFGEVLALDRGLAKVVGQAADPTSLLPGALGPGGGRDATRRLPGPDLGRRLLLVLQYLHEYRGTGAAQPGEYRGTGSNSTVILNHRTRLHALLGFRRGGPLLSFMSASPLLPLLDRLEVVSFRAARTTQALPALGVRPPPRGNWAPAADLAQRAGRGGRHARRRRPGGSGGAVVPTPANQLATTHTVTFGVDAQDVAAQGVHHGTFAEIRGKGVDRSSGGQADRRPVGVTGEGSQHDGSDEAQACARPTPVRRNGVRFSGRTPGSL